MVCTQTHIFLLRKRVTTKHLPDGSGAHLPKFITASQIGFEIFEEVLSKEHFLHLLRAQGFSGTISFHQHGHMIGTVNRRSPMVTFVLSTALSETSPFSCSVLTARHLRLRTHCATVRVAKSFHGVSKLHQTKVSKETK